MNLLFKEEWIYCLKKNEYIVWRRIKSIVWRRISKVCVSVLNCPYEGVKCG